LNSIGATTPQVWQPPSASAEPPDGNNNIPSPTARSGLESVFNIVPSSIDQVDKTPEASMMIGSIDAPAKPA
jgi:hypothetical protein